VAGGRLCPNRTKAQGGQFFFLVATRGVKISMFSLLVNAHHVISSITRQPSKPTETLGVISSIIKQPSEHTKTPLDVHSAQGWTHTIHSPAHNHLDLLSIHQVPLASPGVPTNEVINHPAVQPSISVAKI
jgi:hypothetical protein